MKFHLSKIAWCNTSLCTAESSIKKFLKTVYWSDFKELYAIITFAEEEAVIEVLNRVHFFNKNQITVDRMIKKIPSKKNHKLFTSTELFVGGVPMDVGKGIFIRWNL